MVVADLGFSVVCFVLGAHPRARVRWLGLAGVLAAALVLATAVATGAMGDAASGGSGAFAAIAAGALAMLVAGGGWALGYVRWQTRQRVSAQVQAGLEQERTRIAADMHDLVAHTWAVVAAQADGAGRIPDRRVRVGRPGGRAGRDRRSRSAVGARGVVGAVLPSRR